MLTKRQLILILIAVLAVIAAGATLFYMKKIDQMLQNPMPWAVELPTEIETPTSNEEIPLDPLQEDFDNLLSGESIAEMYEGEENYGFTAIGDQF